MNKEIAYFSENSLGEYTVKFSEIEKLYFDNDKDEIENLLFQKIKFEKGEVFSFVPLKTDGDFEKLIFENAKIIHKSLGKISSIIAMQEKFWLGMLNYYYIDYVFAYANFYAKKEKSSIKSTILFQHGNKRSLLMNILSRLWWASYFLVDEESEAPYELLEFFMRNAFPSKMVIFFSSNFTTNPKMARGIISGIKKIVESGIIKDKREVYVKVTSTFNIMGGVRILDMLTEHEVEQVTIDILLANRV